MSSSFAGRFRHSVDVMVSKHATPEMVAEQFGDHVTAAVGALIASGSASPKFRYFVDGVEGAPLAGVKIHGGTIRYIFSNISEAAAFALAFVRRKSPVDSGDYRDAWFFLVDGDPWTNPDLTAIPAGAEVALTNFEPFHRKIDVGGQKMRVPPGIVEAARQAVNRKFGLATQRVFLTIPGGYILKGKQFDSGLSFGTIPGSKKKGYFRRHDRVATRRKDSLAGQQMTYPALVFEQLV